MEKPTNSKSKRRSYNYYVNQLLPNQHPRGAGDQKRVRMFLKQGGSSMLLCKGLTQFAADNLARYMQWFCKKHNTRLECTFIFTK